MSVIEKPARPPPSAVFASERISATVLLFRPEFSPQTRRFPKLRPAIPPVTPERSTLSVSAVSDGAAFFAAGHRCRHRAAGRAEGELHIREGHRARRADILEARTDTRYLFIDGRPVGLSTRHTDLYDFFKGRK